MVCLIRETRAQEGGWGRWRRTGWHPWGAVRTGLRHRERLCVLGAGGPLPTAVVTSTGGAGVRAHTSERLGASFQVLFPVALQLIRPASCSDRKDVISGGRPSF